MKTVLLGLDADCLSKIITYLRIEEFVRLIFLTFKKCSIDKRFIETEIKNYLIRAWNISPDDFPHGNIDSNTINLKNLIPFSYPRIEGLNNDNYLLRIESNTVTSLQPIGLGNRSIQSSNPFPAVVNPLAIVVGEIHKAIKTRSIKLIMKLMRQIVKINMNNMRGNFQISTPFKCKRSLRSTIVCNDGSVPVETYIGLRSVSYYEVQIHSVSTWKRTNSLHRLHEAQMNHNNPELTECVAVGLSTVAFDHRTKFPGWDYNSYGFHGDDGGIFHGNGRKFDAYGPSFGRGDIVGVGLDYSNHTIFFTLNGKYLGPAFSDVDPSIPYYPTVGIDTLAPVTFNFGHDPFEFDLIEFISLSTLYYAVPIF